MSTSDRAFNQVKAILGKLDRSIDQARERRTQPEPIQAGPSIAIPQPAPIPVAPPAAAPVSTAPGRPPSPYGRAQPLPPRGVPGGGTQPRFGT